jgi:predicted Zn-dependent protease
VLIGAALWLRSSSWLHEYLVRAKDLPELEAIVRQNPDDGIAQYYLGRRYYLARRFEEATTAYATAARLDPGAARTHLDYGLALFEVGNVARAQDELKRALTINDRLDSAEYMLGKIEWLRGHNDRAIPHLKRAISLGRNAGARYGLAICQIEAGHRDLALDVMRDAVVLDPRNPQYHATYGELLVYFGKTEEGQDEYERALQLDADYGPAAALLGTLCLKAPAPRRSLARAEELLVRATRLHTYHPDEVYLDLAKLYARTRRYARAVPALHEALKLSPYDAEPWFLLAQAERRLGDAKGADAAIARYRAANERGLDKIRLKAHLDVAPGDLASRLALARTCVALGQRDEAIQQYEVCMRQQPGSPVIARELAPLAKQAFGGRARDFASAPP